MSMPHGDVHILDKLFGSQIRVRLLRLFMLNPNQIFDTKLVADRLHARPEGIRGEVRLLLDIGYIREAVRTDLVEQKKKKKTVRKKIPGYTLVREFPYLNELALLLASSAPHARTKLSNGLRRVGRVNFLVIAGRLLGNDTEHVDVFVVGDAIKKSKVENLLGNIEADIGKELMYAIMATKEFQYRYGMHDRFVKALLDGPHEILINKLGVFDQTTGG